ncbi:MAG: AbrB/MazE/SpoVT family DNA-binding domain-containing protein [Azonexus sp.]|jgi:antitoxin VapB|uniref:antitoxin n=1 Tax=Azonexus sp. TaxID=1872668 RepID=UPI0028336C25|nr:AbrB/MazE/SpoVT family DNA-binding domain-containing protein [Azonexus sp.]MDR0775067.1 AbrB/MazE/SpoVT family DNA-binding domain-containing protein [Azonexus sp.]
MNTLATARVFTSGNSQAVRLPKSFRLDVDAVWITQNEATGEILLQPKPKPEVLEAFFSLLEAVPRNSDEFLLPRADTPRGSPFDIDQP